MKDITELHLAGQGTEKYETECAESFGIPNMTKWCPDTLLQQSQLHNYYLQRDLEDAYQNIKQGKDSWDFPNAFYLDAADTDGGIRVGTAESGFGPSEVTCAHVLWTDCTGSQPKCPEGYVGTGEKDHWNVYDTDGTKHDFCVVPWHNHYRCCETPSSEIGTSLFHTSDLSKGNASQQQQQHRYSKVWLRRYTHRIKRNSSLRTRDDFEDWSRYPERTHTM